ncbi:insulinoma-associated protein 1a [Sarcoptes scabiei]|nr:insulinoma-associated protein 1a [Sarcoptes scabiei]
MELLIQQQSKRLPTRSYRTQNYPNPFQSVIDFFSKFNTKIIDFFLLMMVVMMMMMMMNIEIETSHIIDQSLENVSIEDLNEINSRIAKDFDRNFSQIIRLKQSTWPSVITIDMIDDNNGEINSTESFQQQQYHHLRNSTEKRRKFPLKIPKLGFGNFHYSRNHHNSNETNGDDYDQDDEDDVSYDFKEYSNINLFDRNQTKDHKTEDVSIEIDNVDVDGDDIAINYDDEDRNDRIGTNSFDYIMIPKIERQLIIGDLDKLPRPDSYLEDQTTPIDFDGCFCDHHFHSTHQSRQSFEIAQDRSGSFSYANHLNFLQQHRSNSLRLKSSYLEIGSQDQSTIPLSTVMTTTTTTTTTPTTSPTINLSSTTVFCYCYGESIKDIPQNFTKTVRKM